MKIKTKRRIVAAIGLVFLFLGLGAIGGIEQAYISFPVGMVISGLSVAAFGLCWHKAGIL